MKNKLLFLKALFIGAMFYLPFMANATKVYAVNEDFTSDVVTGTNWGYATASGHAFGYDVVNKRMTLKWGSPTSFTTKTLSSTVTPGTDNKITIEMIIQYYTSGNSSSSGNLYLLDQSGNAITGVWFGRASSQWRIARTTNYPGAIAPTATATYTNVLAANSPIAKITFILNFTDKTLDYTAQVGTFDNSTRVFTATSPSVSASAEAFINTSATDVKSILSNFYRVSTTSGTNGYDMMYFGISSEQTASTANVTVKFKDQNGDYFKAEEVIPEQVVGNSYNATLAQKANFTDGTNSYVLDPASPVSIASVEAGGSTLELLFRKSGNFSTMTWNGTADTNGNIWSEWYQNFINGTTATASQLNSTLTFDASAAVKSVILNDGVNIGDGSVIINSPDYIFTGNGAVNGTGSMNINLTGTDALSLGVTNNLSGTTQIAGGTITLTKTGVLGSEAVVNGVTTLKPTSSGVVIPTTTFNDNSTIECGGNQSSITNMSIVAGKAIAVNSSFNAAASDAGYTNFGFGTSGTLGIGSEVQFNGTGTTSRFGMGSASSTYLANSKVALKGNAFLFINSAQGAATTISIGTLSGETNTVIGWGRSSGLDRTITWSVGGLNENSEFAGSITNTGGYSTQGASYIGNSTNFIKEGTGILTMSGTANTHNGNFTVNNGTLNVTGAIGNATSVITVGTNGTLKGTGTIGGATTVNGTLEGRLNFGSSLTLNGTTRFVVNGTGDGNFDAIHVVGSVNLGGAVDVVVSEPAMMKGISKAKSVVPGTTIKLINAGSIVTTMPVTHFASSGWTFKPATGELIYDPDNIVSGFNNNSVTSRIYPTLTRDIVNVEGNVTTIDVFSLTGQKVNSVVANDTKTVVNMSNLSNGAYIIRATMEDGSANMQNVILQK